MAKPKKRKKTAKRKLTKRKTTRRAKTTRSASRRARKGYAFMVKLGNDYLTDSGDYTYSQKDAHRFSVRPKGADLVKVAGDRRSPRVVSLHLRQSR